MNRPQIPHLVIMEIGQKSRQPFDSCDSFMLRQPDSLCYTKERDAKREMFHNFQRGRTKIRQQTIELTVAKQNCPDSIEVYVQHLDNS